MKNKSQKSSLLWLLIAIRTHRKGVEFLFYFLFSFVPIEISTAGIANATTATTPERAQPVVKSSCGVEFFFQGKTLTAIVSSFITGVIFTLITVLGIVTLYRYRRKSKSIGECLKLIPM